MSTMKDVAKKAGVSVATVSYAINGTKALSPETLAKIRAAIKELKYSPDQTAKSFKTGRKHIIAFIVPDISNNYFSNIIDSLEQELRNSGYTLIITNTKESLDLEIEQLKYLTSGIVDGIVLASSAKNYKEIAPYIPAGFPVVLVDRKLKGCPFDIISVSDTDAIEQGMDYLLSCGHTKIGYIGDAPHLSTSKERLQAYMDFLTEHDLCRLFSSDDGIIVQNEYDMGISAARQILNRIQEPESSRKEIIIYNEYTRPDQPE